MAAAKATLGGGCFWCIEAAFQEIRGVQAVESGYAGGVVDNPSYEQVCEGTTGHAEVVRILFDDEIVSYKALLEVFFTVHDPTTLNRQGADVGTQYRSVIFYHTDAQKDVAQALIKELEAKGVWPSPIVTEVNDAQAFYPAERYHQNYYRDHLQQRYCQVVVSPKLGKMRQRFRDLLK